MNNHPLKVNVEVIRTPNSKISSKEFHDLIKSELRSHNELVLNSSVTKFNLNDLSNHVSSIRICELENYQGISNDVSVLKASEVKFSLHVYRLFQDGAHVDLADSGSEDQVAAIYWTLPTKEFHGLWDSLIFDSQIKERLLRYAWTLVQYSMKDVNTNEISCNRIVLLHGPPGTGKTSLCKAIAQKLAIRLSSNFRHTILVEVNAHSLFSKYFSESGKLVTKMFGKLREMVSDPKVMVCVLIDEVESLTHSREAASSSSEPSDSVRVVNAVLTQLDLLKQHSNVLIFSTSNISGVVDGAFVDRADLCYYIPNPSCFAIYTIYYSMIEELVRVGLVEGPMPQKILSKEAFETEDSIIFDKINVSLKNLVVKSSGMSGRSIRKIPILAHAYHLSASDTCTMESFIEAALHVVKETKNKPDEKKKLSTLENEKLSFHQI